MPATCRHPLVAGCGTGIDARAYPFLVGKDFPPKNTSSGFGRRNLATDRLLGAAQAVMPVPIPLLWGNPYRRRFCPAYSSDISPQIGG